MTYREQVMVEIAKRCTISDLRASELLAVTDYVLDEIAATQLETTALRVTGGGVATKRKPKDGDVPCKRCYGKGFVVGYDQICSDVRPIEPRPCPECATVPVASEGEILRAILRENARPVVRANNDDRIDPANGPVLVTIHYFKPHSGKWGYTDEGIEWAPDPSDYTGWKGFKRITRLPEFTAVCIDTPLGFPVCHPSKVIW